MKSLFPARRIASCLLTLGALIALAVPSISGQGVLARLEGVVSDSSGAVIPGVTVLATNTATNLNYEALSNEVGRYVFVTLPPGTYVVTVSLPGFKQIVRDGIALQVGDAVTINFALDPGQITDVVNVTGEAPLLDLTTAKVGSVVENRQAVELPLQDRNALMLFYLMPGMVVRDRLGGQQQVGGVDGLAPHTGNTKVEGVFVSRTSFDYTAADPGVAVPQEAVGEYRITTSGATADAGRGSGAQVSVSLKSGTNEFHGSAFEFHRNEAFNANGFFNNRAGATRPKYRRNQYGWSLGGPIIKNKTFFFGTMEWDRLMQFSTVNATVLTPTMREGTFRFNTQGPNTTSSVDAQGNPRVPFGTINLLTVDPTRLGMDTFFMPKVLAVMPPPNNYDAGDGLNTAGYRFQVSAPRPTDQWLFKVEHRLSNQHQVSFSGNAAKNAYFSNFLITQKGGEFTEVTKEGVQVRLVSTFTPTFINEFSTGGNRAWFISGMQTEQESPAGGIFLTGLSSNYVYVSGRGLQNNPNVNLGFSDNLTWIKGNHSFGFGGEMWFQSLNIKSGNGAFPNINTSIASNPANVPALTGLNSTDRARAQQLVNDLTGAIGTITQSFYLTNTAGYTPFTPNYRPVHTVESGLYFQDLWKIRPNLSLELGLRYDTLPMAYMDNGVYIQPIGGVDGALGIQGPTGQPTRFGLSPNGRSPVKTDRNNFGPRLGFSWDPFGHGNTSVSGSYRIAYDRSMLVTHSGFSSSNYGATTQVTLTPFTRLSDPNLYRTVLPIPVPDPFTDLGFTRESRAYVVDPTISTPYVQTWNFRVAQQLGQHWKVDATYVGNHAVGQWQAVNFNQIEMRKNGFLDAFIIAQRNLAQSGNPMTGASLGSLAPLFAQVPSSQYNLITQGQAAALANFLDTSPLVTLTRGGLVARAGLPLTFFRFNPQVQNLNIVGNNSHSTWNALKLTVNKRFSAGLSLQGNYTLGKGFTNYVPQQSLSEDFRDNANHRLDKAISPSDATHTLIFNWIYELPFGSGRRFLNDSPGLIRGALGGWQVNGIYNWATGEPLSITTDRNMLSANIDSTPNFTGAPVSFSKPFDDGSNITTLTPAQRVQFTNPGPGEAGGLPLRSFRAPGFSTLDLSLFRSFRINVFERPIEAQFRMELFNALNKVNFSDPNDNINNAAFGVITNTSAARIGQVALKILF